MPLSSPENKVKTFQVVIGLLTLLLSFGAGYTGRVTADAERNSALRQAVNDINELKKQSDYNREHYVDYREFQRTVELQTKQLDRIEDNISKIQQRR